MRGIESHSCCMGGFTAACIVVRNNAIFTLKFLSSGRSSGSRNYYSSFWIGGWMERMMDGWRKLASDIFCI